MERQPLNHREQQIIQLLIAGEGIVSIGQALHLAPSTVSTYIARAKAKLGAKSSTQLAVKYAQGER